MILSENGPWTLAQTAAARAAVREFLRKDDKTVPEDSEIERCLLEGLRFAKSYQRPPNAAAWQITYYIGVEATPEHFEELAANMRRACVGSGLIVTVCDYR